MLLGQDKRELGALVFPDEEYLAATGADADAGGGTGSKGLEQLLFKEVCTLNAARPDYHPEDHIGHIQVGCEKYPELPVSSGVLCARALWAASLPPITRKYFRSLLEILWTNWSTMSGSA